MPEFFNVYSPPDAWRHFLRHYSPQMRTERILAATALEPGAGRGAGFAARSARIPRSTVDGYAVSAADTYGASSSLPAFLSVAGEVPMGQASSLEIGVGEAALVHTGGMIPASADSVVMVENHATRRDDASIEALRPVAVGENVIQVGEDIRTGDPILKSGHLLRPQDIGGLMALGITQDHGRGPAASASSPRATRSCRPSAGRARPGA